MGRTCLIILISALINYPGVAQQHIFKTYTVQDGVVANNIRRVVQDSKGFIWIATWEGVSKYDGHRFINYTTGNGLSHDVVNDIYEDKAGKLYIAQNNGVLDVIQNGHIQHSLRDSIAINRFFIRPDSTVIAISDYNGIGQFKNGKFVFRKTRAVGAILDYAKLNDSLTAIIDSDFRLVILDKNFGIYQQRDLLIASISQDSRKNIWLCGPGGLKILDEIQYRNQPVRFKPLPPVFMHPYLQQINVFNLFEDIDKNYWISTQDGLVRISPDSRVQRFTSLNGLPTNIINNLFQDREKNIWMCSSLGLVKLVMRNDVQFFSKEHGLESDYAGNMIRGPGQSFYFSHVSRIYQMDESNLKLRPLNQKFFAPLILDYQPNQHIVLSGNEIWRKETPDNYDRIAALTGNGFFSATVDKKTSTIFFGTNKGLYYLDGSGDLRHLLFQHRITALALDSRGYLWAGTWAQGIYRIKIIYRPDGLDAIPEDFTKLIGSTLIRSLFTDKRGNVWIGTRYDGALCFISSSNWRLLRFTKEQGLSSNFIKTFAEDQHGNIWIGTHSGLNKLVRSDNDFRIFNFNRLYNYFGEINSIYPSENNIIWCSSQAGLIRLKDEQVDTVSAPPLYLTSVIAGNEAIDQFQHRHRISYNRNSLHVEFSSPAFINEKSILYSYRLKGSSDTTWSVPSNQHNVSYASIEPGHYVFELRAYGWNSLPGEIKSFAFTIRPPFWKTWWFYLLCSLFFSFLIYQLYRYRISQILKLQNVRNRIATDLHDDIGSTLTNISILSELSNKSLQKPEEAKKYLKRINEEVNTSGQALDDIIWSVYSRNDTIEDILVRMRRFAAELFDHTDARCHLQLQSAMPGKRLNMEQRRDIYLIYKESLNNIYKHANAAQISVELKLAKQVLELIIEDDGIGFDPRADTSRNGLKNMQARINKWKGSMKIDANPGKGTRLVFTLPVG